MSLLEGCADKSVTRRCVDQTTGQVLPESYCNGTGRSGYMAGRLVRGIWGYGGSITNGRLSGHSNIMPTDRDVKSPSGTVISRGFGSSSGSSGGFSS
jgi:hypothetical protein